LILFFDVTQILVSFGYAALFAIIFAETGLLLGFFLPGDTLLFTAGILASKNVFGLPEVILVCFVAAVLGDSFGYYLGRKYGKRVFEKEGHFLDYYLNKENLERTKKFFAKYGGKTIFFARYVPVVRTIAPTMAGTGEMHYATFLSYNVFGGAAWVLTGTLLGFFIRGFIPNAIEILTVVIIAIVVVSFVPVAWQVHKRNKRERREKRGV
jgi:membrane-associated protein